MPHVILSRVHKVSLIGDKELKSNIVISLHFDKLLGFVSLLLKALDFLLQFLSIGELFM